MDIRQWLCANLTQQPLAISVCVSVEQLVCLHRVHIRYARIPPHWKRIAKETKQKRSKWNERKRNQPKSSIFKWNNVIHNITGGVYWSRYGIEIGIRGEHEHWTAVYLRKASGWFGREIILVHILVARFNPLSILSSLVCDLAFICMFSCFFVHLRDSYISERYSPEYIKVHIIWRDNPSKFDMKLKIVAAIELLAHSILFRYLNFTWCFCPFSEARKVWSSKYT